MKYKVFWLFLLVSILVVVVGIFYRQRRFTAPTNLKEVDSRYLGPPDSVTGTASSSFGQNSGLTLRLDLDTYLRVDNEVLQSGPVIVAIVAPDNKLGEYSSDLVKLAAITNPEVTKWVGFSSFATLTSKLSDPTSLQELRDAGISGFTYNSEGQHTPRAEMQLLDSDGSDNIVAQFARLTTQFGFQSFWVPSNANSMINGLSTQALQQLLSAGLSGVVIQEQRQIEASCPEAEANNVNLTISHLHSVLPNLKIGVQLMTDRCKTANSFAEKSCGQAASSSSWTACGSFLDFLQPQPTILSLWTPTRQNDTELLDFVNFVRP